MSHAPSAPAPRTTGAALADALAYPLQRDALIGILVLSLAQIVCGVVPVIWPLLQLVVWAAAYRYALEILAASGQGRAAPPQGWLLAGDGLQRSHLWLQAICIIGIVIGARWLGAGGTLLLIAAAALALPGALLALAAAQNLLAAFNPGAWWAVARIIGPAYPLLAAATAATLLLQLMGGALFARLPVEWIGQLLWFGCVHYALFALFRLLGLALYRHADELGLEQVSVERPVLVRERETAALDEDVRAAAELADPRARAAALAAVLRRGGADAALHGAYRQCLRQLGDRAGLRQHAEVRCCELVALGKPADALALAAEALGDYPGFALPEADATAALLDIADARGALRQAAALTVNYRKTHPKRRDGLPLARRGALLLADRLADRDGATQLLEAARVQAEGTPEATEFDRLLRRLQAGLPLGQSIGG